MKTLVLRMALLASIVIVPALARADLHIYFQDSLWGSGTYQDDVYGRLGANGSKITLSADHRSVLVEYDGDERREFGFNIGLSDKYQGLAFYNLLKEGKISCLPVSAGALASHFQVSDVPGAKCRARDVTSLVTQRAEMYRRADENKGVYSADWTGRLDRLSKVSDRLVKVLRDDFGFHSGTSGRSNASGAR